VRSVAGVSDDTAFIQDAINTAGADSCIFFPAGTYLVTSQLTVVNDRVYLFGAGAFTTQLLFMPTAAQTCLYVNSLTSGDIFNGGISSLSFYSADSAHSKVAINLVHVSDYFIRDVVVGGSVVHGNTSYWSDSGNSSIAFKSNGHEAVTVRKVQFVADRPIYIGLDPKSSLDCDHFHFQDLYLIGNQNPLITVEDGCYVTNLTFDGHQAWVKGTYGFYWNDTIGVSANNSIRFDNVRMEQTEGTAGYWMYIAFVGASIQGLTMNNFYGVTIDEINGFYFRNIAGCSMNNVWYIGNKIAFNANSSCAGFVLWNTYLGQAGAALSVTGFVDYVFWNPSSAATARLCVGSGLSVGNSPAAGEFLQLPNNKYIGFRNNAGNATKKALGVGTNDHLYLFPDGGTVNIGDGHAVALRIGLDVTQPSSHEVVIPNATRYAGENAAGSDSIDIVGIDGSDRIIVASNGRVVRVDASQLGFFAKAPANQQASAADLTNNVTAGGVDNTIANYTDLVTYANDAAAIRNDIYQLSRKLKQINDGLRLLGLFN
jgi:hypothetical protein